MALSYRRFLYQAGANAGRPPVMISTTSKRFFSDDSESAGAKPYRPWPMDVYRYPANADYWIKEKGVVPQDAKADVANYPTEELYIKDIEARMEKYGKKYGVSDRVKNLFNEYGWQDDDDRPFSVYGSALKMSEHEEEKWGPGKKITVTHYFHSFFHGTNRQPIPPIEYMNGEQIRRVRGRLSPFREWPQETPSIWKSWNPYITIGAITAIGTAKELFFFNSHDFKELFYLWGTWAFILSIGYDWMAYFYIGKHQEEYDRQWLPLNDQVQEASKWLDRLDKLPNFKSVYTDLQVYRQELEEKVLQRSLANRVQEDLNLTLIKLEQKIVEERSAEAEFNSRIRRKALESTLKHFDDQKVRKDFTAMVIKDFSTGNSAQLVAGQSAVVKDFDVFAKKYESETKTAEKDVMNEARKAGTLPWKFRSAEEKAKAVMSPADKEKEFRARVEQWAQTHNAVPNPSFA